MCKQNITIDLEDFTEDGYLKYEGGYIGISEGSPLKGEDLVQLKWYAEPVIKPTLLSEALYLKESLNKFKEPELVPVKFEEVELQNTKCGHCCVITCGLANPEHKECHCNDIGLKCADCKHKDICF